MPKSHAPLRDLGHEGADAFAKVTHHLKAMTQHLGEEGGDALSATAVALGHAAVDLVGEVQTQLDDLRDQARREVRRHPVEAVASTAAAAALLAAAVASLTTYALTRRQP
jgi:hypothetical protein